jgi:hypothetical protein
MVCSECKLGIADDVRYCPRCGTAVDPAPGGASTPPPAWIPLTYATHPMGGYPPIYSTQGRLDQQVQTLGILWSVYAGYRALHALMGMAVLHTMVHHYGRWGSMWPESSSFHMGWLAPLMPLFGVLSFFWVAMAAFTGYSLLTRKTWGRTLAIVVAIFTLLKIPLGTALGIYTLRVLLPAQSDFEYRALASR